MSDQNTFDTVDHNALVNSVQLYVLPASVYRAIIRNKLNIIDAVNYRKLRNILSIDDLAEIWHVNTNPLKAINDSTTVDLSGWGFRELFATMNTLTPVETNEIQYTIQPLSGSITIAETLRQKLSTNDMTEDDTYYKLLLNNNIVFVVLENGFLTRMQNLPYRLDFYRNILKELYKVTRIPEVSRHRLFNEYLKALQVSSDSA